ncbi:uncharacterized protein FYW47_015107 [Aplochiton taeniatus]
MSQLQLLRALIRDRLIAAADEIFGAVERTIADYQEEVYSLQPTQPQQHCEQERSPGLDQEDPEPTPIKEEHEEQQELCISQEKSFQGLEEEEDDDDDDDAEGSMLCVEPEDDPQQHCEQERSPRLDQEDPEPTPIKEEYEEQQELCINPVCRFF